MIEWKMSKDIIDNENKGIMEKSNDGLGMELKGWKRLMFMLKRNDDKVLSLGCEEKIIRKELRIGEDRMIKKKSKLIRKEGENEIRIW